MANGSGVKGRLNRRALLMEKSVRSQARIAGGTGNERDHSSLRQAPHQKRSFSANWMSRGDFAWLEMTPKVRRPDRGARKIELRMVQDVEAQPRFYRHGAWWRRAHLIGLPGSQTPSKSSDSPFRVADLSPDRSFYI